MSTLPIIMLGLRVAVYIVTLVISYTDHAFEIHDGWPQYPKWYLTNMSYLGGLM